MHDKLPSQSGESQEIFPGLNLKWQMMATSEKKGRKYKFRNTHIARIVE
jgi:hypothetical protein